MSGLGHVLTFNEMKLTSGNSRRLSIQQALRLLSTKRQGFDLIRQQKRIQGPDRS